MAKKWLAGSAFEKLTLVGELKNDREKALDFIEKALKILHSTINEKTATKNAVEARKLLSIHKKISQNGNIKLSFLAIILG